MTAPVEIHADSRILLLSKWFVMLLAIMRSNSLLVTDVRLMGRDRAIAFLKIGVMFASLRSSGTSPDCKDLLNSPITSGAMIYSVSHFFQKSWWHIVTSTGFVNI